MPDRRSAWRQWTATVERDIRALAYAYRDPAVPWYAKALVLCLVAYALSPIDLIPDVIPVLGYLDDALLLPLGVLLAVRLIPPTVLAECRRKAEAKAAALAPRGRWIAAAGIVIVWIGFASLLVWLLQRMAT